MAFATKTPWYAGGLAFECTGCGNCCAGPNEGYVWVTAAEVAAIAEHLGIPQDQMREKYVRKVQNHFSLTERKPNNDCAFLSAASDGRRECIIYPVRPTQCRAWPFWPGNLRGPEDWALAGLRCGGINRGEIHSCDEIERKRKATRR